MTVRVDCDIKGSIEKNEIRLGDITIQIRGVSYKPSDVKDSRDVDAVPLLRANNIQEEGLNFDDLVYVDKKRIGKDQYLRSGDILICSSSGSKSLVGKAAFVKEDLPFSFGAFCKVIRTNKVFPNYLGQYFRSPRYRNEIAKASAGANINNIRNENIENLLIPYHSEEEQVEIANILEKVDELIACENKRMKNVEQLVKSRFIEVFGDPVANPYGWDKIALSELADVKIGPFGSLLHKEDYIAGGHALVNPSHIVDGRISIDSKLTISDGKYKELSAYHLRIGDVVMGRRGEMGRCAVVEEAGLLCGTGSLLIRTKGEVRADYLQKIISFPSFKKTIEDMAVGQTMPNLNVPIVSGFQIIKPPLDVQQQYYSFVAATDKSKQAVQKSLDELEILKKSLMQKYFG